MRYFTSDQHFYDSDIMSYCNRPYDTPEEMNADMINRFNLKTHDASEIYIIGDIFGSAQPRRPFEACFETMCSLGIERCPFHLIRGNHDSLSDEEYLKIGFRTVQSLAFIDSEAGEIMLTHDPCMVQPIGTLAICGHIHTLFNENWQPNRNTLSINVSVEVRDYTPISEKELMTIVRRYDYIKLKS